MQWRILSRTWLRYFGGVCEFIVAFLFVFIIIVFVGESIATGNRRESGDVYIYVRSNGVHTDICLPVTNSLYDWKSFLSTTDYDDNIPTEFVAIGWGDKGFYMNTPEWEDLTVNTAFTAIAIPSATAMHVSYEYEPTESDRCTKVYLSEKEYLELIAFVKASFNYEKNRVNLIPGKGYNINDNFYEANNSYHLFRTCNTWTCDALRQANVRTSLYTVFPGGIMKHLK